MVNVSHLAFVSRARVCDFAEPLTAAMKRQLARGLIELHAGAPQTKAAPPERVVRCAHASANRAEAVEFVERKETTLAVVPQMIAHDAPFAAERENDGDNRARKDRHHHHA